MSAYSDLVVADGATFYYRLGEASGSAAVDAKGAAPNGVYTGGVVLGQPGAIFGDADKSVLFGPTGAYVDVPASPVHTTGWAVGGGSCEAWIYPTAALSVATDDVMIFAHAWPASYSPVFLGYGSAQSQYGTGQHLWGAYYNGSVDGKCSEAAVLALNQWHHIVYVCSANSVSAGTGKLYHNGALVQSVATSFGMGDASSDLLLGEMLGGSTHSFPGRIDEVAGYKGVLLTPAQVLNHYTVGTVGVPGGATPVTDFASVAAAQAAGYTLTLGQITSQLAAIWTARLSKPIYPPLAAASAELDGTGSGPDSATAQAQALAALNATRRHRYCGTPNAPSGTLSIPNAHGDQLLVDVN